MIQVTDPWTGEFYTKQYAFYMVLLGSWAALVLLLKFKGQKGGSDQ